MNLNIIKRFALSLVTKTDKKCVWVSIVTETDVLAPNDLLQEIETAFRRREEGDYQGPVLGINADSWDYGGPNHPMNIIKRFAEDLGFYVGTGPGVDLLISAERPTYTRKYWHQSFTHGPWVKDEILSLRTRIYDTDIHR